MHGPVPFHPSPPHFAMTTPAGIGLYLQRPPQPPPIHMPMLRGPGGPYVHSHAHTQHQQRDPRRQRPSKRVRQRMRRQPQRDDNESREDNLESIPLASESGYDTTGDCQTPATPLDSPLTANGESKFLTDGAKQTEGENNVCI